MAQPTTPHSNMTQQAPTPGVTHGATPPHAPAHAPVPPGVGMQGNPPPMEPVAAAEPVLFDDIDPVLLIRLYPGAVSSEDMRAQAMAAGQATFAAGQELEASQQEPVNEFDEHGIMIPRDPARERERREARRTAGMRPGDPRIAQPPRRPEDRRPDPAREP